MITHAVVLSWTGNRFEAPAKDAGSVTLAVGSNYRALNSEEPEHIRFPWHELFFTSGLEYIIASLNLFLDRLEPFTSRRRSIHSLPFHSFPRLAVLVLVPFPVLRDLLW